MVCRIHVVRGLSELNYNMENNKYADFAIEMTLLHLIYAVARISHVLCALGLAFVRIPVFTRVLMSVVENSGNADLHMLWSYW